MLRAIAGPLTFVLLVAGCAGSHGPSVGTPAPPEQPPLLGPQQEIAGMPVPIRRTTPLYPSRLAARGDEGWVRVSVVVEKDGSVADPLVEDSTNPRFERPTLDCVRAWRYAPAMRDGRPVEQTLSFLMSFEMEGHPTGGPQPFAAVAQQIDAGDLDGAAGAIAGIERRGGLSLRERAYLYARDAELSARRGEDARALHSLERALRSGGLDEAMSERAWQALLVRRFQQAQPGAALAMYESIRASREPLPEPVTTALAEIRRRVGSSDLLARPGRLALASEIQAGEAPPAWKHTMLRRAGALHVVAGHIDTVELRCRWHRAVLRTWIDPDLRWTLPERWGACDVFVLGDPGTTFTLTEYPLASTPVP